ncbi:MAG TPA: glycosyltransferase family A protein [Thermoanaerobaculia bacterium]|jgi:glycosyltransferase involved in cell wall biosynthesis|nr:glycosyltransferase family A protein [Thermoanaerobaculia bacterium]
MTDVSVVMGVYNGAATLRATLASILAQEDADFEVIVVDDGSTDDTALILREYPSVRVITQQNAGLTRALIAGCAAARGQYIARHDTGDTSHPRRLSKQKQALDEDEQLAFVSCWTEYVGPEGEPLFTSRGTGLAKQAIDIIDIAAKHGAVDGPTAHGAVMFRRDAYERAGGYRAAFYFGQDWDLWYRLAEIGTFRMIEEVLFTVMIEPSTISSASRQAQMACARLSHEALLARRRGDGDAEVLARAAGIQRSRKQSRSAAAGGWYFIGEALRRNGDRRARRYLRRAIAENPLMGKAWIRYLQALL